MTTVTTDRTIRYREMMMRRIHVLEAELHVLEAERDALKAVYAEEKAIVDRCWKALGITTYDEAKPFAIDEHIARLRSQQAERDAALREVEELREALREEPGKWGWDVVMLVGRRVLDELYPADIFTGASGDLGPVYIVALRNALAALAEKGKP